MDDEEQLEFVETIVTIDEKGRCSFTPTVETSCSGASDIEKSPAAQSPVKASKRSEGKTGMKRPVDNVEEADSEDSHKKARLEASTAGDDDDIHTDYPTETLLLTEDDTGSCRDEGSESDEYDIFEAVITVSKKGKCSFEVVENPDCPTPDSSNDTDILTKNVSPTPSELKTSSLVDELNQSTSTKESQLGTSPRDRLLANCSFEETTSQDVRKKHTDSEPADESCEVVVDVNIPEPSCSRTIPEEQCSVELPSVQDYVSLDCEFVGVIKMTSEGMKKDISALGRCSIVDYEGRVLCDVYANPDERIMTLRTRWSGITKHHMRTLAIPIQSALAQISNTIRGKIVVGHALDNDFGVLGIDHPAELRRDTSLYKPFIEQHGCPNSQNVSLKVLAKNILGTAIQKGSHCSIVDAQTTMAVFKTAREEWETTLASGESPLIVIKPGKKTLKKLRQQNLIVSSVSNNDKKKDTCENPAASSTKQKNSDKNNDLRVKNVKKNNGPISYPKTDNRRTGNAGCSRGRGSYGNYPRGYQNGDYQYGQQLYNADHRRYGEYNGYGYGGGWGQQHNQYFEDEYWPDDYY